MLKNPLSQTSVVAGLELLYNSSMMRKNSVHRVDTSFFWKISRIEIEKDFGFI